MTQRRAGIALVAVTLVLVAQEYFERGGRSLFPGLNSLSLWTVSKLVGYLLPLALVVAWRGDHGLGLGDTGRHWKIYLTIYLAVLPLVVVASFGQGFRSTYPFHVGAHQLAWELVYGSTFVALEFFFRGFALFTLDRAMGKLSIFVLVVPYTMIHFGKPLPEVLGAAVAGVVLGYMALKTRSIWGGVAVHLGVAWTMDALALYHNMK